MAYIPANDLDSDEYVIVDMDTGTIIGTNVMIVRIDNVPSDRFEAAHDSDSDAWDMAEEYGANLFAEV